MVFHPDKNPGDPDASQKFLLINKAHSCFKNDEALEKCNQFGNPEGTNNYKVGIAFPTAFLKKENKLPVLTVFFVCMFVILPICVFLYTNSLDKYDENGVQVRSREY